MLPRGLISFADRPRHQLEINLISNILSWTIGRLWIHHKILMSTNAPTSRFGFASFWCKEDGAWSISLISIWAKSTKSKTFFYVHEGFRPLTVHPRIRRIFNSSFFFFFFFFFLFFFFIDSWRLGGLWLHKTPFIFFFFFYRKPTLVSLVELVLKLSCSASNFFFFLAALLQIARVSCECQLYKKDVMLYGLE